MACAMKTLDLERRRLFNSQNLLGIMNISKENKKHLIIGDSLLRDVKSCGIENTRVECIQGATILRVKDFLAKEKISANKAVYSGRYVCLSAGLLMK